MTRCYDDYDVSFVRCECGRAVPCRHCPTTPTPIDPADIRPGDGDVPRHAAGRVVSADRLREAARVLRERAEAATPGPWEGYYDDNARPYWSVITNRTGDLVATYDFDGGHEGPHGAEGADAAYIATMHPGVGLALADWLEKAATEWEVWGEHDRNIDRPLVVANLILGAES